MDKLAERFIIYVDSEAVCTGNSHMDAATINAEACAEIAKEVSVVFILWLTESGWTIEVNGKGYFEDLDNNIIEKPLNELFTLYIQTL